MNTSKNHLLLTELERDSLLNAAFDFGLKPCEFKVYFHLVHCCDESGLVAESTDRIAKACKLNRKTVMQALNALLSMGMIRRLHLTRSYTYQLTMPLDWVERPLKPTIQKRGFSPTIQKTDGEAIQKTDGEAIQKTDGEAIQKTDGGTDSSSPPLKGDCYESSPGTIQKTDCETIQKADYSPPVHQVDDEPTDLDSKLAAARGRGWSAGSWWNDQSQHMVTVNSFTISVDQFLQRSLDTFDCVSNWCARGVATVREVLNKIKRRSRGSLIPNTQ